MKRFPVLLMILLVNYSLMAQPGDGIEAIYSGMYSTAKRIFIQQLADSTAKPEACYYLGEAYRLSGNKDSAAFYFDSGSGGDNQNSLCMVGKAGLLIYSYPSMADELIKKARSRKEYKQDPELYVAIAKIYAENKQFGYAYEMLEFAKNLDKKCIDIYLTEGNILLQQNNPGEAAAKYLMAISINDHCKPACLKLAQMNYKSKNYDISLKYIDKIKEIDQHFPPVIKLYGDICYELGKYSGAVSAYTEYLQTIEAVMDDRIRYAYSLFFNKEYEKSRDQITQLIPYYSNNQVLKRLLAYSLFETGNYSEGLNQIQAFLNIVEPTAVISSDYKYYARLLSKNDQDSLSIINFKKAILLSTSPQEFYKELAIEYEKMKKFGDASIYFEKYVKSAKAPTVSDFFSWGKDCYFAAAALDSVTIKKDSSQIKVRNALYFRADSIFKEIISSTPENYLGYLWRARVNTIFDPETEFGLAKPYYEKVTELLELSVSKNDKELIESYQYLGYYYYLKGDFKKSKIYWNKIIAIDPNNSIALKAIEGIK